MASLTNKHVSWTCPLFLCELAHAVNHPLFAAGEASRNVRNKQRKYCHGAAVTGSTITNTGMKYIAAAFPKAKHIPTTLYVLVFGPSNLKVGAMSESLRALLRWKPVLGKWACFLLLEGVSHCLAVPREPGLVQSVSGSA